MPAVVYTLCAITSSVCAWLLCRAYFTTRTRFLLWPTVCFLMIALNNILLLADELTGTLIDLALPRSITLFVGVSLLLYGFIWELE